MIIIIHCVVQTCVHKKIWSQDIELMKMRSNNHIYKIWSLSSFFLVPKKVNGMECTFIPLLISLMTSSTKEFICTKRMFVCSINDYNINIYSSVYKTLASRPCKLAQFFFHILSLSTKKKMLKKLVIATILYRHTMHYTHPSLLK